MILLLAGTVFGVASGTAAAEKKPPSGTSAAVAQYVEQIPTSTGSKPTGFGKTKVKPLAPKVKHELTQQAGKDAPLLEQVATSSAYGAPQQTVTTTQATTTTTTTTPKTSSTKPKPSSAPNVTSSTNAATTPKSKTTPHVDLNSKVPATKTLSAAAGVVTDGSDGRIIGLAIFLALTTVAALGAAAYRQRAQRGSGRGE